jgi:hypothetical protein
MINGSVRSAASHSNQPVGDYAASGNTGGKHIGALLLDCQQFVRILSGRL